MEHKQHNYLDPLENSERGAEQIDTQLQQHEIIDVRTIFAILWRAKLWLFLATLAGAAYGTYQAHSFSPEYVATMIVDARGSETTTLSSQFASAVQLVGALSGGGGAGGEDQSTTFQKLQVLLSSRRLAEILDSKHDMLTKIYGDNWNQGQPPPSSDNSSLNSRLTAFFNLNAPQPPSIESLAQYVGGSIQILPIPESVFVEVTYANEDPAFARWFLSVVFEEADNLTRLDDLQQTERRKQYILQKLKEVTITDMRQGLLAMLGSLERREMFLKSDDTYSVQIVERARSSLQPTEPKLLFLIGGPAFGALIAASVILALISLAKSE